jgi:hypothetical protein
VEGKHLFINKTKTKMASKKDQLFAQMNELWNEFEKEHHKPTKVSQKKARTLIGDLKKLVTEYRAASVEESKNS